MNTIKLFQVDAFSDHVFGGNPAAICPLDEWPDDAILQKIAMENNLAETGYYVARGDQFEIRWFTPQVEVDLCGHATLAAAHVLFHSFAYPDDTIHFHSPRSGALTVKKEGDWLTLDFPTDTLQAVELRPELTAGFNRIPVEAYKGKTDYMLVFADYQDVAELQVDILRIAAVKDCRGIIVTAPGRDEDFVSRFFAPQSGIAEDPVTGSAHTTLTPYWSRRLTKTTLTAAQLSPRRGMLRCTAAGARTLISGQAILYMKGEIFL